MTHGATTWSVRAKERLRLDWTPDRLMGMADQVLLSSVTFAQIIVGARLMEQHAFGLFSMALALVLVAQGLQRSAITIPMLVAHNGTAHTDGLQHWVNRHTYLILGLCLVVASTLIATWLYDEHSRFYLLLAMLPFMVALLMFEFQRRLFYQLGRPKQALHASILFALCQWGGLGALSAISLIREMPIHPIAMLLVGCLASFPAITWGWRIRASLHDQPLPSTVFHTVGWNVLSYLPYLFYNHGMVLIVGLIGGAPAAGVFAGTRLFCAPLQLAINGVDTTDKPRAHTALGHHHMLGLRTSLASTRRCLLWLALPYSALVMLAAPQLVPWLLGATYADAVVTTHMWVLAGLIMVIGQPLETGLIVLRQSQGLFASRCAAAILAMVGATLAIPHYGASGGVLALMIGWGVAALIAQGLLRRMTKGQHG